MSDLRDRLDALSPERRAVLERLVQADAPESGRPRTAVEATLAEVWASVLGVERIGVDDNFFDLGGDSIVALQVVNACRSAGLGVTPRLLLQHQTIAELALVVAPSGETAVDPGPPGESRPYPLTPIQRWFFANVRVDRDHWNQGIVVETAPDADLDALGAAFSAVVRHHDGLRYAFADAAGRATPLDPDAAALIRTVAKADDGPDVVKALQRELDLGRGPTLAAAFFEGEPRRLAFVAHHLVMDVVSLRIVLDDLAVAYEQLTRNASVRLAPATPYADWADSMASADALARASAEERLWLERLASILAVPARRSADAATYAETRTVTRSLSPALADAAAEVARTLGVAFESLLIAAFEHAARQLWGPSWGAITLERHGRDAYAGALDLSRSVGWFTAMFPFVVPARHADPGETARHIDADLRSEPGAGIGFGLLAQTHPESPLAAVKPDVAFNYLGRLDRPFRAPLTRIATTAAGPWQSPRALRPFPLDVVLATIGSGALAAAFQFGSRAYGDGEIEALADAFTAVLTSVAARRGAARSESRDGDDEATRQLLTIVGAHAR